jgi:hypothetical protein
MLMTLMEIDVFASLSQAFFSSFNGTMVVMMIYGRVSPCREVMDIGSFGGSPLLYIDRGGASNIPPTELST